MIDFVPVAHAGHILIDAGFFLFPVGSILLMVWILNRHGPKDD